MSTPEILLKETAFALGIDLSDEAVSEFTAYTSALLEWNRVMNLTAITQPEEIVCKHYIDSLTLLRYASLPENASLADVGCGAGFPGIPLKIARPDIRLTCLDSLNKRIHFLEALVQTLALDNVRCLHMRAEEAGRNAGLREKFDAVTARAVARMSVLAEYCLPLVRVGGYFYAMKGPDGETEAREAAPAIRLIGGSIEHVASFSLPHTDMLRTVICVRKVTPTPASFPRTSAVMAKKPLGTEHSPLLSKKNEQ